MSLTEPREPIPMEGRSLHLTSPGPIRRAVRRAVVAVVASGALVTGGMLGVASPSAAAGTPTTGAAATDGCTAGQLLVNPGFEEGNTGWTASPLVLGFNGATPHSGSFAAWLDGYGTTHTDTLSQSVTIPATCTSANLTFYLLVFTDETGTTANDKLTVAAGTTTLATYTNLDIGTGYLQRTMSLTPYIGQTVTLTFTGTEDALYATSFQIDDTAVNVS